MRGHFDVHLCLEFVAVVFCNVSALHGWGLGPHSEIRGRERSFMTHAVHLHHFLTMH